VQHEITRTNTKFETNSKISMFLQQCIQQWKAFRGNRKAEEAHVGTRQRPEVRRLVRVVLFLVKPQQKCSQFSSNGIHYLILSLNRLGRSLICSNINNFFLHHIRSSCGRTQLAMSVRRKKRWNSLKQRRKKG
jgi:hypothetical protein